MLGTYALSAGYYDAYYRKATKVRTLVKKDFEEASVKIEELMKIDKNDPHAYLYKAKWFYDNSKLNEALKEIDRCLEIAGKKLPHPNFYLMKSMILKKQDNDEYVYYENKAKELMKVQEVFKEFLGKNSPHT